MTVLKRLRKALGYILASISIVGSATCFASEGALTQLEVKWLDAADPVLQYAVSHGLPIDVVIRPNKTKEVPFSVGVEDGRCKLILAMRDRSDAEATLAGVPQAEQGMLIEAMTAHEIAHCWRYKQGLWNAMPPGIQEPLSFTGNDDIAKQRRAMRTVQSEEAFADLVALAWTQLHHPQDYKRVYGWLTSIRSDQPVDGSFHDTRAWIALANNPNVFVSSLSPFEQVQELWVDGLKSTAARL